MATMLSSIPLAARGPAQIFIFDIHALQERFYFSELVIPRSEKQTNKQTKTNTNKMSVYHCIVHMVCFTIRLLSAIPLLLRELRLLPDSDNVSIAFPDEGAWKRFHSDFTALYSAKMPKVQKFHIHV